MPIKKRVGLVGLGDVSKFHLEAILNNQDLVLVAVCDINESKDPKIDGVGFSSEFTQLLEDRTIDAIVVATPHNLHAGMTNAALYAGKDVLVEKPMAPNLADAQKMTAVAASTDRTLVVSYHFQFVPEVRYFLANKEQYGKIHSFWTQFSGPLQNAVETNRPWLFQKSQNGGVWIDNGTNVVSVLSLFLPDLEVTSARFEYEGRELIKDPDVEDFAKVNFTNGKAKGSAIVDWRSRGKPIYFTYFDTDKGRILLNHFEHKVIHKGNPIFQGVNQRYAGVYADFVKRLGTQGNGLTALGTTSIVMDDYSKAKAK